MTESELIDRLRILLLHTKEAQLWITTPHAQRLDEQAEVWANVHTAMLEALIRAVEK